MSGAPTFVPVVARPVPRRRWRWRALRWLFIIGVWLGLMGLLAVLWLARDLPRPDAALDAARRPGLSLQDRSGAIFATFGDVVGEPLRLKDLPRALPAAAVAVEDRRFYRHSGLDLIGIARAVFVNVTAGRLVQGGSTITQQVAKTLFLSNARTARRKVQEVLLTIWLERTFSKTEILEIWLNRVYLGGGAWGMDAAARLYFGVSARNLNVWQSAVLAGLPRAPSRINPRADPVAAAARGREVLTAMADTGALTRAEADAAAAQIAFTPRPATAGWFAEWVAEQSATIVPPGADALVQTSLDARLQAVAEARLTTMLDGPGAAAGVQQGAVVVLDATTGAVRAMVGGRDWRTSPFNRAVAARRQPGSAFKPFVWLAALETGLTPDSTVLDAPIRIGAYAPTNYDGAYRGEVTLEDALAQSLNTASVRLMQQAGGPRAVAVVAKRLGIGGVLPPDLSLALGTGEVGLLELAAAYAPFANGGHAVTPWGIGATQTDGKRVPVVHGPGDVVMSPEHAADMLQMLTAVVARGSGRAAALPGRAVAGKTGTTQDFRDAWFMGVVSTATGPVVIGVWLGNDDARSMRGVTGAGLPARVFHDVAAEVR